MNIHYPFWGSHKYSHVALYIIHLQKYYAKMDCH